MKWLYQNSLGTVLVDAFLVLLLGQFFTGLATWNCQREERGLAPLTTTEYLQSGHFNEATSENWESEFLQMAAYVLLTVFLRQKGSAESKKLDGKEEVDQIPPPSRLKKDAPWPVRVGGIARALYAHSLSISFLVLFLLSFLWHAYGGYALENEERRMEGLATEPFADFVSSAEFWFQSSQNWQSEFLAVAAIVILTIWLREKGSPESKPVAAPHSQTGK